MRKEKAETGYTGYGSTRNEEDPYNTCNGEMKCWSIGLGQPAIRHNPFNTEENEMTIKPSLCKADNKGLGVYW